MLDGFLTASLQVVILLDLFGVVLYFMSRGAGGDGGRRVRSGERAPLPAPPAQPRFTVSGRKGRPAPRRWAPGLCRNRRRTGCRSRDPDGVFY